MTFIILTSFNLSDKDLIMSAINKLTYENMKPILKIIF